MGMDILPAIECAIAALTIDDIERTDVDNSGCAVTTPGNQLSLLERSIGIDLGAIVGTSADRQRKLIRATHLSIDEALLALEEARQMLAGGAQ